jgi:hypothetical protein
MQDKRAEPRNPCFLKADIITGTSTAPIPAEAHDISDGGLRLVVESPGNLPDEFILSIPRRRLREIVQVIRRDEQSVGVRIQGAKRAGLI